MAVPYAGSDLSLEDWFATCPNRCDAEGVLWFLRDAASFCLGRFGESPMTTDAEARSVHEGMPHSRAAETFPARPAGGSLGGNMDVREGVQVPWAR